MISTPYVAGLFDGEGSVGLYNYVLRVQMVQNKSVISLIVWDQVRKLWGGSISDQKTLSGKIKINWQLNGASALRFLTDVRPYIVLKRDQVDLAIDFLNNKQPPRRSSLGQFCPRSEQEKCYAEGVSAELKRMKGSTR